MPYWSYGVGTSVLEPGGKFEGYANCYDQNETKRLKITCLCPLHNAKYATAVREPTPMPIAFAVDATAWAIGLREDRLIDEVVVVVDSSRSAGLPPISQFIGFEIGRFKWEFASRRQS